MSCPAATRVCACAGAGIATAPADSASAAAKLPRLKKLRTGREGPVRDLRNSNIAACRSLAALARTRRSRIDRRRLSSRCTSVILAIRDVAVDAAIVVAVGPDCAGDAANGSTDHRTLKDAETRDQSASGRAE